MEKLVITEVRNAQSRAVDNDSFDVEINHPQHGWLPYSVGAGFKSAIIDNEAILNLIQGNFTAYMPEPVQDPLTTWRNNAYLSRLDFCMALVKFNIITKDQALATIDGLWPAPMLNFLDYLDADQAFGVQMEWKGVVTVNRNHTFILSLGSWLGLTATQLDEMFGWVLVPAPALEQHPQPQSPDHPNEEV
jgi:hypothetical protein